MKEAEILLAQTVPAPSGSGGDGFLSMLLFMGAMFLLLYALMIRPQSRQRKEHEAMVSALKKGDQVVTSGGLHGRVTGVSDEVLTVEIANNVRVRVNRSAVSTRVPGPGDDKEKKS